LLFLFIIGTRWPKKQQDFSKISNKFGKKGAGKFAALLIVSWTVSRQDSVTESTSACAVEVIAATISYANAVRLIFAALSKGVKFFSGSM